MKTTLISLIILMSFLFAACAPAAARPTQPTAMPPVIADAGIIAEGRVEPLHFAEIAFTTGGVISEVLVQEGETVKQGQPLIRLGDASDTNYAACPSVRSRAAFLAHASTCRKSSRVMSSGTAL